MSYAAEHASALADVKDAGARATFTLAGQGTVNMATDGITPSADVVVAGYAIGKRPSLTRYQALGLLVSVARTLFFVPDVFDTLPALSSTIPWGGATYAVKNIEPLMIDDHAIAATVVVAL